MSLQDSNACVVRDVPEADCVVNTAGGEGGAVGRAGESLNGACVSVEPWCCPSRRHEGKTRDFFSVNKWGRAAYFVGRAIHFALWL